MKAITTLALLAGCAVTERIDLQIVEEAPTVFSCVDRDGPLVNRAGEPPYSVQVVIDFLELPVRIVQVADILRTCRDPGCPVRPEARLCASLDVEIPPERSPNDVVIARAVNEALTAQVGTVLETVPPGGSMVRAVFTTAPCESLDPERPFENDDLIACAVSAPVDLRSFEGQLELDLPTLSSPCDIAEVRGCANLEQ
ncbi:MAG: hypothetical protein AAGE52_32235 [Myxococcota bacterium]